MLNSIIADGITTATFLACTAVSCILGVLVAIISSFRTKSTQSFSVALAVLPAVVQIVIMLVNGNVGAGVAVAGAFGLVRFRSAPGSAREICSVFLAMALGLATGMGYILLACTFFAIMGGMLMLLTASGFGKRSASERVLKITIPENLDYDGLFDDIFEKYGVKSTLERVRTTNMGTLYELKYSITVQSGVLPKSFIDELRCRNGNLSIVCGRENETEAL